MCYMWLYVASSLSRYNYSGSELQYSTEIHVHVNKNVRNACLLQTHNCFLVPLNVKTQVMEMIACLIWLVFGVHYRKLLPLCSHGWAGKEIFGLSFV